MANRRTLDEQIDAALKEREQRDKRIKDLLERKRTKEDKARNHRLCKRGGLVEKLYPLLAKFTDEQFSLFVDLVLKSDQTKIALDEIMPPEPDEANGDTNTADGKPAPKSESGNDAPHGGDTGAQKNIETAAQSSTPSAAKPSQIPQNNGTDGNAHNGNRPPQNGNNNATRPANTPQGNHNNGNGNGGNGAPRTS